MIRIVDYSCLDLSYIIQNLKEVWISYPMKFNEYPISRRRSRFGIGLFTGIGLYVEPWVKPYKLRFLIIPISIIKAYYFIPFYTRYYNSLNDFIKFLINNAEEVETIQVDYRVFKFAHVSYSSFDESTVKKIPFLKFGNVNKIVNLIETYVKLVELRKSIWKGSKIRQEIDETLLNLPKFDLDYALQILTNLVHRVEKVKESIDKRVAKLREKMRFINRDKHSSEIEDFVVIEFETSWRVDDLREKYVIDDALIGIAVHGVDSCYPRHFCVTTTRDRKKIIVLLNAKVFNPSEIELKISIPEKLVKKTGTVYKTIWQIYKNGEPQSTLLTLVIRDNNGRFHILYPDQRDLLKPIQYLDMYCMGLVENYRQWKEIKDTIELEEY